MIIIDTNDYRIQMGEYWQPGMLAEAMKIASAKFAESLVIVDNDYDFVIKFAESLGWDTNKLVAFVGVPLIDYNKFPHMEAEIRRYTDNHVMPCIIFETHMKSLEEIVNHTVRITKLKAFI